MCTCMCIHTQEYGYIKTKTNNLPQMSNMTAACVAVVVDYAFPCFREDPLPISNFSPRMQRAFAFFTGRYYNLKIRRRTCRFYHLKLQDIFTVISCGYFVN